MVRLGTNLRGGGGGVEKREATSSCARDSARTTAINHLSTGPLYTSQGKVQLSDPDVLLDGAARRILTWTLRKTCAYRESPHGPAPA